MSGSNRTIVVSCTVRKGMLTTYQSISLKVMKLVYSKADADVTAFEKLILTAINGKRKPRTGRRSGREASTPCIRQVNLCKD